MVLLFVSLAQFFCYLVYSSLALDVKPVVDKLVVCVWIKKDELAGITRLTQLKQGFKNPGFSFLLRLLWFRVRRSYDVGSLEGFGDHVNRDRCRSHWLWGCRGCRDLWNLRGRIFRGRNFGMFRVGNSFLEKMLALENHYHFSLPLKKKNC